MRPHLGWLVVKRSLRKYASGAAMLAGIGAGMFGSVAVAGAVASTSNQAVATHLGATTDWPKNAQGLTYGSALNAVSPQDEPDLIQVQASNGKTGYVLRADLEPSAPKTPAEALAHQAAQQAAALENATIPVYTSDGTTQIGIFVLYDSSGAAH